MKDYFLYIYEKIAKCSGRKQKFLFTRPSPLATPALGKLYLRKTRISRFVWAKELVETYPGCQRLFMHGFRIFVATRAFGLRPTDPATREKKNLWYRGYFIWLWLRPFNISLLRLAFFRYLKSTALRWDTIALGDWD